MNLPGSSSPGMYDISQPPSIGYLSSNASQTSIVASPDSLFTVTPASSTSTSPAQSRNVTPMGQQPLQRTLGQIPEVPSNTGVPRATQSAPGPLRGPLSAGPAPSPVASAGSPASSSSSPHYPSRSGLQPMKMRLENVDVLDPLFLKLASETAQTASRTSTMASQTGTIVSRTSTSIDEPRHDFSGPSLTTTAGSTSPESARTPDPSPVANVSPETAKRSAAYKAYIEKRYSLLDEVANHASEVDGGKPKTNPWNLVDMMRWRERNKAVRTSVGRSMRTR